MANENMAGLGQFAHLLSALSFNFLFVDIIVKVYNNSR